MLRLAGGPFRAASNDPTGPDAHQSKKPARGGLSHVQERRHQGHSSHRVRLRRSLGVGRIGSGSPPERARGELRGSKGKPLPRLSGRGFVVAITQHFRRRAHDSAACLRDRYRLPLPPLAGRLITVMIGCDACRCWRTWPRRYLL